jgi:hypothetical protein
VTRNEENSVQKQNKMAQKSSTGEKQFTKNSSTKSSKRENNLQRKVRKRSSKRDTIYKEKFENKVRKETQFTKQGDTGRQETKLQLQIQ